MLCKSGNIRLCHDKTTLSHPLKTQCVEVWSLSWSSCKYGLYKGFWRRPCALVFHSKIYSLFNMQTCSQINTLAPGESGCDFKIANFALVHWLVLSDHIMIMPSDEYDGTSLMISQHWFRLWLDAIRQQAITWANVDQILCRHMMSLGHSVLSAIISFVSILIKNDHVMIRYNCVQYSSS